ncbi:hypothetical protein MMC24_004947 [Lignoscripta atroalba]|nr:hypothetical protein [Lignoscripta atroalba]
MPSLQPLRLILRPSRPSSIRYNDVRWLSHASVRHCACSGPPPTKTRKPKFKTLNPTTPEPPIPPADHRALGTNLDLFSTSHFSPGSPLFHPDGAHIFQKLQSFLRAQYAAFGFREVITPTIYKQSLWEQSGHWENYKDDMFEVTGRGARGDVTGEKQIGEDEKYGLKPMNCPGHCLLFQSQKRSYRDLPIRYADFSPLHRNEISGALSGLTRVRRFHQDDGHIFCRPNQVKEEIEKTLQFVGMVYGTFGLGPYKLVLSTRPKEQFMGEVEEWDRAESQLREALDRSGRHWEVNEGDGAFYGPKIDIILKDSDGKEHQTATVQLDFQLPQRFKLTYHAPAAELEAKGINTTDTKLLALSGDVTPVIIHRAILGSLERFMALLIEQYKGRWPFWLSPRQAIILTIGEHEETINYATRIATRLAQSTETLTKPRPLDTQNFLVDTDFSGRSVSKKVAEAKKKHYNLICVVGPTEATRRKVEVDITGQPQQKRVLELIQKLRTDLSISGKHEQVDLAPRAVSLDEDQLSRLMKGLCKEYL